MILYQIVSFDGETCQFESITSFDRKDVIREGYSKYCEDVIHNATSLTKDYEPLSFEEYSDGIHKGVYIQCEEYSIEYALLMHDITLPEPVGILNAKFNAFIEMLP